MNTHYILYHANCADGFAAAMVFYKSLIRSHGPDHPPIPIPVGYGQPVPPLIEGSVVYIVDFSYPAMDLVALAKQMNMVTVLDHHATAAHDLSHAKFVEIGVAHPDLQVTCDGFLLPCTGLQVKFDMNKSGAMMAWEFCNPGQPPPKLIEYVQDRDLWRFELLHSKEVSAYLQTQPMELSLWSDLMTAMQDPDELDVVFENGKMCLRLKAQMVDVMVEHSRLMMFDIGSQPPTVYPSVVRDCSATQYLAPVANATVFYSEVGEALLQRFPQAKFAGYYMDRADGLRQWGLRSHREFDCSVIARAFGGGGHKQTSGFTQKIPW